jgi:DNA topoisomerase IA
MADQIVITEKSSQARDVRAVVGSRFGDILPAEGHLIDWLEPEDVVPEWKMVGAIDAVCDVAQRIIGKLTQGPVAGGPPLVNDPQ